MDRINNIRTDNDNFNIPKIGLYDTDAVIKYYFDNVIKLQVIENEIVMNVPVMYGSPERWKSIRVDGFMKDNNQKIMVPLIAYQRDSIELNKSLARNLDANNPQIFHNFVTNSQRNKYNSSSAPTEKELYRVVIPNYVYLSYNCIVWTNYTSHMNKILEDIIYTDNSYWGDPLKIRFHTSIDNISTPVEVSDGNERSVRSTFTIKMNGYIIPENLQKKMQAYKKILPTKIILTEK